MNRAIICACLCLGVATGAMAQSSSARARVRGAVKVDPANAQPVVRIAPTTMRPGSSSLETGGDTWDARGYDLKTLISQIYDLDERRVDFAVDGDPGGRYDMTVSLPKEVSQDEMQRLLTDAIQRKFGLDVTQETRAMYVYAMTAPKGPGSGLHPHAAAAQAAGGAKLMALETGGAELEDVGEIKFDGRDCPGVSSGGITATAETISDFGRTLEPALDRVLVDETGLTGTYDFQIGGYASTEELFKLLRDQLGLVIKPVERKVTVLRVRTHGEFSNYAISAVPAG